MDAKEFATIPDVIGHSLRQVSDFKDFDLSFKAVARIDQLEVHSSMTSPLCGVR